MPFIPSPKGNGFSGEVFIKMNFKIYQSLKEALELHKELNPKLYENNKLKSEIREALLKIIKSFLDQLEENRVPLNPIDYWLVGSNASFNYSSTSDIDIHIIVNLEVDNKGVLELLYNYIKSDFNRSYDIKIKGLPVELYIEGQNTTAITNGIYSILKDEWVKEPQPIEIPDIDIEGSELYQLLYKQYLNLTSDLIDLQNFIDRLYIIRKSSLANEGEFGIGNLVFKELRNKGYLDNIKDRIKQAKSKELTLEKLEVSTQSDIESEKEFLEAYLDKEEKFWDYKTGDISNDDIFSTKKTGFSYWDQVLTDPEYMKTKGYSGKIIQMSPKEYFEACGEIFGTTSEAQKRHIERDQDILKDLYTVINKYKQKFPLTYLNVKDKTQEGRHRMYVAGELFGWDHKFPVLIIQDVRNPRFV